MNKQIEMQLYKLTKIGLIILFLFGLSIFLKMMSKKYITENDRFYMANKVINFGNFILIMIILLFNYIENVSYLVTVLGFASAGIAIAMKDWFMSMLGWLVIVLGGSIHVGDRVRVDMDGMQYVGDDRTQVGRRRFGSQGNEDDAAAGGELAQVELDRVQLRADEGGEVRRAVGARIDERPLVAAQEVVGDGEEVQAQGARPAYGRHLYDVPGRDGVRVTLS